MKNLIVILALLVGFGAMAQDNQFSKASDSDPKATAILESLKKKYQSYKTVSVNFDLKIEIAESDAENMKGKMYQAGDKYRVETDLQDVICDGETIWLHMKNNEEVQIMDMEESDDESGFLSPKDLLNFYEQGKYAYTLVYEGNEKGKYVQKIEFKPLDRDSEYSKMRMTVDKRSNTILRVKVFSKDGSRFTLDVLSWKGDVPFKSDFFTFDTDNYKGHVEDLRW